MTTRKSRGIIVETNILKKHTEAYYEKNCVFGICKNVEGGVQKYSVIAALCGLFVLFTGCENFLRGQDIKDEILSAIEYNNAPSYTILVETLNRDVGVIKSPVTGQVQKKVTDTFTVKFEPDSKYTFVKWQAVIEGMAAGETTEDYIHFEDPQSLETKVTLKKTPPSVISLRPVCPENLLVSFNASDAATVYPCDTPIQLTFNKPIAAACKDKVIVRIPDIPEDRTALSYFKSPLLDKIDLTLFADVSEEDYSNRIPVTSSGKIISVILNASDFYYENTDYGEVIPIYLKNDITFSYSINLNTSKKSTIKYVIQDDVAGAGLLRVDEDEARTQAYRIGKEINLKYVLQNDDYAFKGWSFAYAATEESAFEPVAIEDIRQNLNIDIKYEANNDTFGYDSLTKTAQAKITIYNYKEGIISVSPIIKKIATVDILIEGSNGKFNPAKGNHATKQDQINTISFEPDDDYEFLHWQVYDVNTKQPLNYTDFLEITDVNSSDTTYKLLAVPSESLNIKIGLRAVVTERPQVISATPSYTATGAYRDSRIQVVFDKDIDENSIYYSGPEITDLIDQLELDNEDFLPQIDPTKPDEKHYGYVIRNDEGEIVDIVYKNIKIQNNRNINENLLKYFDPPFIENSKILIIPTKLNQYPVGGTTLLVTLDKSFSTFEQGKSVGLREAKKWIYFVNSKTDTDAPEITEIKIRNMSGVEVTDQGTTNTTAVWMGNDTKLKFLIDATDTGNGLANTFDMVFENETGYRSHSTVSLPFEAVEGSYATCGGDAVQGDENVYEGKRYAVIKLSQSSFTEGMYKFHLEFTDCSPQKNRLAHATKYVLWVDNQAPSYLSNSIDENTISAEPDAQVSTFTQFNLSLKHAEASSTYASGYDKCRIFYRAYSASPNWSYATEVENFTDNQATGTATATITRLFSSYTYEIKVDVYDKAGNVGTYYLQKNTYPQPFLRGDLTCTVDEVARVLKITHKDAATLATNYKINGAKITLKDENNSSATPTETICYINQTSDKSFFVRDIDYAGEYSIKVQSVSKDENIPDKYANKNVTYEPMINATEIQLRDIITNPLGVTNVTMTETSYNETTQKSSVNFTYTIPDERCPVKISYGKYNELDRIPYYTSVITGDDSKTIENLEPGTRYNFKFETYYSMQSNLCSEGNTIYMDVTTAAAPVTITKPDPVTNLAVTMRSHSALLTWTKPANYQDYSYYEVRWTSSSGDRSCKIDTSNDSLEVANLTPGNDFYRFYVTVYQGDNSSQPCMASGYTMADTSPPSIWVDLDYSNCYASGNKVYINAQTTPGSTVYLWNASTYASLIAPTSSNWKEIHVGSNGVISEELTLGYGASRYYVFSTTSDYRNFKICSEIIHLKTEPSSNANYYQRNIKAEWIDDSNCIKLSWEGWARADVYYKRADANSWNKVGENKTSPCQISGLARGVMYEFDLDSGYQTSFSSYIGRTIPKKPVVYEETTPFTSFEVSNFSTNTITLSWELEAEFTADSFKVYREGTLIADNLPSTVRSITDCGIPAGTTLGSNTEPAYRIVAYKDSKLYKKEIATTKTKYPKVSYFRVKDNGVSSNSIQLEWSGSYNNGCWIFYKKSGTTIVQRQKVSENYSSVSLSNLTAGTKYDIWIENAGSSYATESNSIYNSEPTTISVSTNIVNLSNMHISQKSNTSDFTLYWSNPNVGPNGKTIIQYKNSNSQGWIDVCVIRYSSSSRPSSCTICNLVPENYDFRWITYGDIGMTQCSNTGTMNVTLFE